jgi:cytochrome c-type biogenesis protein CcmH/NrfG
MKYFLVTFLTVLAVPAFAAEPARDLLHNGQYEDARAAALAVDTVEGLNAAAEVMAAEIMLMRVDDAKDHAKAAIKLADRALKRDPGNVEALFMRALHTGFRTRSSSAFAIVMKGLIGDTYEAIEAFESAAPNDPRADALYGAWHLGIVRAAGDGRFGASLADGLAHYDRAVAAMPTDIVVMGNYAFSLIVMDDPSLIPRATTLLQQIEGTAPNGATEGETRARMLSLLAVIDDPDALRARSKGLLNSEEIAVK